MNLIILLSLIGLCLAEKQPRDLVRLNVDDYEHAFTHRTPNENNATTTIQSLQENYVRALNAQLNSSSTCDRQRLSVRRSWSALSPKERTDYLLAVKCMASKPHTIDRAVVPGARNRLDDFTYSHINQTNYIHNSGLLLPWHRQFIWSYEQALRTECNYTGAQPYWDWAEHADNQSLSAVFDGTPTSFGSNGHSIPHPAQNASMPGLPTPFYIARPAGTGAGCIAQSGGLGDNFTINLGPVSPANNTPDNPWGLKYNPRCLKRDFLPGVSSSSLSYTNISSLLMASTIHEFRPTLEFTMHPASHSSIGGDAFDLYSSPTDPVFYLLHGQIDRLWTIWQGQDSTARTNALDGTVTFLNDPPSANATLDTIMKMGKAGGDIPISAAMSATGGNYCYMYE